MSNWETAAEAKRNSANALIPKEWLIESIPSAEEQRDVTGDYIQQYLSAREVEITTKDAETIVGYTSTGAWKAREVTEAFCHRAALAHQLVNCLHEIFFEAALEDAQKLDDYYAENGKPIGPLHGLPVSLKDQFHVKGVETTMGYVGWIGTFQGAKGTGKEKVYESEMTRELRASGAILYCKTAVPQSLMTGETINHIIKYCWNPKNRNLSCGGSSGGEGALIALKGSVVGIGTDIGGSIRLPGSYNGVYGLRPSSGRLPFWGAANSLHGLTTITSVTGPLSSSIGGLRLITKSLLTQEPWLHDPLTLELPWRHELEQSVLDAVKPNSGKQLIFGILWHDAVVRPSPPVTRALAIVSSTLKKLGHNVISWDPPSHAAGNTSAWAAYLFDRGHEIHANLALSNEPIVPQISALVGSSYAADTVQATASDIMATNIAKREYQKAYLDYWNAVNADAFISPVNSLPAPREGGYSYYGYSIIVNVLDLPAVVFPVTEVDKEVDRKGEFVPLDPEARDGQDERSWREYDPEVWHGAPVGLQAVGRRLQEEKVLALVEVIAEALGKRSV